LPRGKHPPQLAKIISASGVNGVGGFFSCRNCGRELKAGGRCLSEPARDARHRFAHVVGRARVGKANEGAAVDRIEIDARRRRDMRLLQHPLGEIETVGGEFRDVGIEIERAVGRQEFVEAGLRQPSIRMRRFSS
jgi:hypothetical protein